MIPISQISVADVAPRRSVLVEERVGLGGTTPRSARAQKKDLDRAAGEQIDVVGGEAEDQAGFVLGVGHAAGPLGELGPRTTPAPARSRSEPPAVSLLAHRVDRPAGRLRSDR